ncbi:MAG: MmcQ/YjbR family DNA-binding protein [Kofleriaceae bacterium]
MARVKSDEALEELKAFAMAYPGTSEKAPWPGHNDVAVNDKTFVYLNPPGEPLAVGCKLVMSSHVALMLPWVKPMHYGMGKYGWVSATPPSDQPVPIEMFKEWIDESYRDQAPKKLVALIGAAPAPKAKNAAATKKPAAKKKPVAKKPVAKKPAAKKPTAKKKSAKK